MKATLDRLQLKIFHLLFGISIEKSHDKDAAWITPQVKSAIKRNSRVYCKWNKRGRKPEERASVIEVQKQTDKLIKQAKNSYYEKLGNLLSDPTTGEKNFFLCLGNYRAKTFLKAK